VSAWIVSRAHIDVLVQGLAESEHVTDVDPDEVGRELWRENLRSVAYRYPGDGDGERPGPIDFRDADVDTYTYRRPAQKIELPGLLQAVACYQYQSCEHREWEASEAYRWTQQLREALERNPDVAAEQHSGDHPWGYEEEDVHAPVSAGS